MAPLELLCRGGDPRAMKGFIAAALAGVEVTFAPLSASAANGSAIRYGEFTDANAIARFLLSQGGCESETMVPRTGQTRWAVERWVEWEASTLAPAVALACASKDPTALTALLSDSLKVRLAEVGFDGSQFTSLAGKNVFQPTLADVAIFASLYAVLGENGAAGVVTVSAPDSSVTTITKWFNLLTTNERVKQGLGDSKASPLTACASCALDGNALKVRVAFPKSRRLFTAPCRVHYS